MTAIDAATPLGRHRRTAAALALLAGGALALTACGAGQISQTATQVAAVNGNSVDVGDIQLRNVHVVYPTSEEYSIMPGGTVELGFTAINSNPSVADELTDISSPDPGSDLDDGGPGRRAGRAADRRVRRRADRVGTGRYREPLGRRVSACA